MYKVIILPTAQKDIRDSFKWYEQKKKDLGYDLRLMYVI